MLVFVALCAALVFWVPGGLWANPYPACIIHSAGGKTRFVPVLPPRSGPACAYFVKMGRMHSGGKGISKSSLPYKRSSPSWLKTSAQAVTEHVCKLAKKGLTPSQVTGRALSRAGCPFCAKEAFVFCLSLFTCRFLGLEGSVGCGLHSALQ